MRYRKLDENGDYTFGQGVANFYIDNPDAVRQSVLTRLRLLQGEWFLDKKSGTPWLQQVLDKGHSGAYDLVIQTRILQTNGVQSIDKFQSMVDTVNRKLRIACLITTVYSTEQIPLEVSL